MNPADFRKLVEEIKSDIRERIGFKKNETYFSTDQIQVEEDKPDADNQRSV